ncbi:hypothetical protein F2Q69_00062488 [Brassica cretica]|uniref:Uncharacterized protein n=1 Tax=Brassica cretica TaxID=69181 RepID=A0A8S9RKF0_BRACR|nr:hypothetical protein F2Q69_00062488 [Brassica cretica]
MEGLRKRFARRKSWFKLRALSHRCWERRWGNDHRSKLRKEEERKTYTSEEGAVTGEDVGGGAHPVVAVVLVFVPERKGSLGRTRSPEFD